jgi:integrase
VETLPALSHSPDLAHVRDLVDKAKDYIEASRAPSTIEGYRHDFLMFTRWATTAGLPVDLPIPVGVITLYLTDEAERLATNTLARRASAIRYMHHQEGYPSPTDAPQVRQVMAGIKRTRQDRLRQARPLYYDDVAAAVADLGDGPKAIRDSALLLVGWWGAFRRSELTAMHRDDLIDHPQGMIVTLRRSKTDQEGRGREVPLHYRRNGVCPVRAARAWACLIPDDEPNLFRRVDRWGNVRPGRLSTEAVSRVVKDAAARIGMDPKGISAHSLRAGFVSECDRRGVPTSAVRLVTGHQSDQMLNSYQRPRSLFESSAGAFFDT